MPERIKLEVYVNLDPMPGTFHSKESARNVLAALLRGSIPHYYPTVSIGKVESGDETGEKAETDDEIKVGDVVQVDWPQATYNREIGTVTAVAPAGGYIDASCPAVTVSFRACVGEITYPSRRLKKLGSPKSEDVRDPDEIKLDDLVRIKSPWSPRVGFVAKVSLLYSIDNSRFATVRYDAKGTEYEAFPIGDLEKV